MLLWYTSKRTIHFRLDESVTTSWIRSSGIKSITDLFNRQILEVCLEAVSKELLTQYVWDFMKNNTTPNIENLS